MLAIATPAKRDGSSQTVDDYVDLALQTLFEGMENCIPQGTKSVQEIDPEFIEFYEETLVSVVRTVKSWLTEVVHGYEVLYLNASWGLARVKHLPPSKEAAVAARAEIERVYSQDRQDLPSRIAMTATLVTILAKAYGSNKKVVEVFAGSPGTLISEQVVVSYVDNCDMLWVLRNKIKWGEADARLMPRNVDYIKSASFKRMTIEERIDLLGSLPVINHATVYEAANAKSEVAAFKKRRRIIMYPSAPEERQAFRDGETQTDPAEEPPVEFHERLHEIDMRVVAPAVPEDPIEREDFISMMNSFMGTPDMSRFYDFFKLCVEDPSSGHLHRVPHFFPSIFPC